MYFLLSGTQRIAAYESWSHLIKAAPSLVPINTRVISLLKQSTREDCVGKPMPFYALLEPKREIVYWMVQRN